MNLIRRIYNYIRRHKISACTTIETAYVYLIAYLLSINIKKKCRFYGIPYFNLGRNSQFKIGQNCIFRSSETSNNMGLHHRCICVCSSYQDNPGVIEIGDNCGFSGVSLWCVTEIKIGNGVRVGANTLIMDHDAHLDDPRSSKPAPITIKNNVFIGANSVIKKGVTIGENSMIGMNSVVTRDIPANCVAVGIPAKVIRQL